MCFTTLQWSDVFFLLQRSSFWHLLRLDGLHSVCVHLKHSKYIRLRMEICNIYLAAIDMFNGCLTKYKINKFICFKAANELREAQPLGVVLIGAYNFAVVLVLWHRKIRCSKKRRQNMNEKSWLENVQNYQIE